MSKIGMSDNNIFGFNILCLSFKNILKIYVFFLIMFVYAFVCGFVHIIPVPTEAQVSDSLEIEL